MNGNDFVRLALRTPLHALLGDTMLITVTGRKTGRKITLPVNFHQQADTLWVLSSRDRTWWRNLIGGAEVDLLLHGRNLKAYGEAVLAESAVIAQLTAYVTRVPGAAKYLGLRTEQGVPNCDDLARSAKERLLVKICLEG